MGLLKRILGKFVKGSGKEGSPRLPVFYGATLGEILDVFYFIGRFFTAGAGVRGKCPGRSGQYMVIPAASKSFVHAETAFPPSAPRARRISARPFATSH